MSSPFTSYSYQPAPTRGPARPPAHVYPFQPLAGRPLKAQPYKPPRRQGSGRGVLIVLAVVLGIPAALVLVLGLIVTGVATIPAIAGVLIGLVIFRPHRRSKQRRR